MFFYGRTKFIFVSSVIFMYKAFFVNNYCNATGHAVFIFIHLKANSMKNKFFEWNNF